MISYLDVTNFDLKFVKCSVANCSTFSTPVTIDEVMESRLVADPITLLQMCPNADGAAEQ